MEEKNDRSSNVEAILEQVKDIEISRDTLSQEVKALTYELDNKRKTFLELTQKLNTLVGQLRVRLTNLGNTTAPLSRKEREVYNLIIKGYTNKQVGEAMGIGERTVKFHVGNLFKKTHTTTRYALISKALDNGNGTPSWLVNLGN